ncbi:hypothetical protein [Paenibacillus rhizophilus]|uniref:J domain-containing protein n=1 Tax=Paenibacillus rhizophilus TaxID=1850366 RepID=A0A3N9P8A5_9BACL|nr:hypothetical protein [Paenibacillus rhizophilus]RQW11567.1 hypothetical protein EH198_11135 [Paenibacillus rhizophilus]
MKDEVKEAYKLLGLPEDVTKEEVNRRFDLLLKRRKSASGSGTAESGPFLAYEDEMKAYRLILDDWARTETQEAENKRLAKWGRFAGTASRLEDFFRLYKTHVLVTVAIIAVLIAGGVALQNHLEEKRIEASLPPVDLNIMFIGNYMPENDPNGDGQPLEEAILKAFPDWRRVEVQTLYIPSSNSGGGAGDMAYTQKAVAELTASPPDLLVLDKDTLPWLAQQGGLELLDETQLAKWFGSGSKDGHVRKALNVKDGIEHPYGIDFTDSALASSLPLKHAELIAGVYGGASNKEKAFQFLERCAAQAGSN